MSTQKAPIEPKDFWGNSLEIGDKVAFIETRYQSLQTGGNC